MVNHRQSRMVEVDPLRDRVRRAVALAIAIPPSLALAAVAMLGAWMSSRAVRHGKMGKETKPWTYGIGH